MKKIILSSILFLCVNFTLYATPYNIAPQAKVTATSEMSNDCIGIKVIDGVIGVPNQCEWTSKSTVNHWGGIDFPRIRLEWEQVYSINRIIVYDRATSTSHTAAGTLHFSDGSKTLVNFIPNNGQAKVIDFPSKKVTWVEQTATDRVSFYRLRHTQDGVANLLVNLGGYLALTTMADCRITKVSNTEIEGSVNTMGRLWGGPDNIRIFFVMRVDKPFEQLNGWVDKERKTDITSLQGIDIKPETIKREFFKDAPTTGVTAKYTVKAGDEIQVKFAISYTSIENARNNMDTDGSGWNFDTVRSASQKEWNDWLGRIDVKGGSYEQQTKFYTDLWHALLGRQKADDASGDYPDNTQGERTTSNTTKNTVLKVRTLPKNTDGMPRFHIYNSDAGYGGHDEDQGQMSGVSALMSMGLFSLQGTCSQNAMYDITSPVFDEITIQLDPNYCSGKAFKIKVYNNSEANCYIQKVTLNNQTLNQLEFSHEDFAKGGMLEIWLGSEPNKSLGINQ